MATATATTTTATTASTANALAGAIADPTPAKAIPRQMLNGQMMLKYTNVVKGMSHLKSVELPFRAFAIAVAILDTNVGVILHL